MSKLSSPLVLAWPLIGVWHIQSYVVQRVGKGLASAWQRLRKSLANAWPLPIIRQISAKPLPSVFGKGFAARAIVVRPREARAVNRGRRIDALGQRELRVRPTITCPACHMVRRAPMSRSPKSWCRRMRELGRRSVSVAIGFLVKAWTRELGRRSVHVAIGFLVKARAQVGTDRPGADRIRMYRTCRCLAADWSLAYAELRGSTCLVVAFCPDVPCARPHVMFQAVVASCRVATSACCWHDAEQGHRADARTEPLAGREV